MSALERLWSKVETSESDNTVKGIWDNSNVFAQPRLGPVIRSKLVSVEGARRSESVSCYDFTCIDKKWKLLRVCFAGEGYLSFCAQGAETDRRYCRLYALIHHHEFAALCE
jgi:hypothetical protein